MSSYNNFIYNGETDTFYILVYKLGSGSYSTVWFGLEFENFHSKIKNRKILKINPRALKIHNEEDYEQGENEMEINKYVLCNKKKCQNINYPLSSFVYEDTYYIVVYEVAIGSLYDIMKIFDKKLPLEFVIDIIPQLIKPIEFIHKCRYIHTDIKPENYLLMGLDQMQKDIVEYSQSYNLGDKLKKIGGLKKMKESNLEDKMISDQLNKFLKLLSNNFGLKNNVLTNDSDSESLENNNDDNCDDDSSLNSFYSIISDESKEEDYETVSSYDSRDDEYDITIDNFHTSKVIKMLFEMERKQYNTNKKNKYINNINNNEKMEQNKKQKYLIDTYFKNPIIKLTDFGTMIKMGEINSTIQTRYYRAPEIILGQEFNEKIDLWSLGCSIYELITGKILFYTCKDEMIAKYDVDLINIKMMFEKLELEQRKILLELIYKSKRKNNFLNKNNCLNFFKKIEYEPWINDILSFDDEEIHKNNSHLNVKELVLFTKKLLNVNPNVRNLQF